MTEPMTNARLDEIDDRLNAATPGDWYIDPDGDLGQHTLASTHAGYTLIGEFNVGAPISDGQDPDEAFVEHATRDMAELVAEVRRLRAELADTRTLVAKSSRADLDRHAAHVLMHAASELRAMHPAVYEDAGQRTADGILRAADALERQAREAQLAAKEA